MIIREAEPQDAPILEMLYRKLHPDDVPIMVWADRIEQIAKHPDIYLLVLEEDERILGTALLHLCLDVVRGDQPFAIVDQVIIDPEHQMKNGMSFLMKHIETFCHQRKCVKVILTCDISQEAEHRCYTELGYRGDSHRVYKKYLPY